MKIRSVGKIIGIGVLALLFLYILLLFILGPILHPEFYRVSERIEGIPGLTGDFVPQGVTMTDDGTLLICGYSSTDNPSRIYRIKDGKKSVMYLENEDGTPYKGHAGGITAIRDYVYISNANKIFILTSSSVLSATDGDALSFLDHFSVPCRSSFCSSDGSYLYVGEYHAKGYETDDSHIIETRDGKTYEAITFAYKLNQNGKADTEPSFAYSTPDIVQGFATLGDKVALSLSSGLKSSTILFYDGKGADSSFLYEGKEIPLTILDSNRLISELDAPHMSEDMEYRDGVLFIAFEAGAKKYGMGLVPSSIKSVMGIEIKKLFP